MECLTLCTTATKFIDLDGYPRCLHCGMYRTYGISTQQSHKESQTETNDREQELQIELHNAQNIIDKQKLQIDELTNKVLILEDKLQHYVTENEN